MDLPRFNGDDAEDQAVLRSNMPPLAASDTHDTSAEAVVLIGDGA